MAGLTLGLVGIHVVGALISIVGFHTDVLHSVEISTGGAKGSSFDAFGRCEAGLKGGGGAIRARAIS